MVSMQTTPDGLLGRRRSTSRCLQRGTYRVRKVAISNRSVTSTPTRLVRIGSIATRADSKAIADPTRQAQRNLVDKGKACQRD